MKKVFILLTFALCATFLFAQSATPYRTGVAKPAVKETGIQNACGSSLFTKEGAILKSQDFSVEGLGYSIGVVSTGTEAHGQTEAFATWLRCPDVESSTLDSIASIYPHTCHYSGGVGGLVDRLFRWTDSAVTSAENGFMLLMPYEQSVANSGNFNTYILIDSIDISNARMVDVEFYQSVCKYHDYCYIDYSTDGITWNEFEINITGVDVTESTAARGFYSYSLPAAAANGNNLSIRIRYKSLNSSYLGYYGYWWLIDDVSIVSSEPNRMRMREEEYVEGNYAQVPQGMQINPAWYGYVYNNGAYTQNNVNATLYHLNASQDSVVEVERYNNQSIPFDDKKSLLCDMAGWINPDFIDYRGWYGYIDHTPHGSGIALPTETFGDNYMFATVGNDSVTIIGDTMYYRVTGLENGCYRWGHDNGVLVFTPTNYWLYGFVQPEPDGYWYATENIEEVHFYEPGYMVASRFTTGAVVPEGWAIRGVELVASPIEGLHTPGAKVSGILMQDEYNGDSVDFHSVLTGANVKEITSADVNDGTVIGPISAGYLEPGNYNTVVIEFPEQPALEPNTSYRIGYRMENTGWFALAHESCGFYHTASPTSSQVCDTVIYFRDNAATTKYAHHFQPNSYQTLIHDPFYSGNGTGTTFAWYHEYNPMIRMLVGPAQEVNRVNIGVGCDGTEHGSVTYGDRAVCGETITPVEGSTATLEAIADSGYRITHVYVDGEEVVPWDGDSTGDINLIVSHDDETGVFVCKYSFTHVQGNHNIRFEFGEEYLSINPSAAGVRVNLQPNPATAQVNLNITGATGKVNCMLIDMSGRVVYNQEINAESANIINLSNLAKGAYFVRITNDQFSKVEKLIVR